MNYNGDNQNRIHIYTHPSHHRCDNYSPFRRGNSVFSVITTTILVIQQSIIPSVYNNNVLVHNDNCRKALHTIITLSRTKLYINCVIYILATMQWTIAENDNYFTRNRSPPNIIQQKIFNGKASIIWVCRVATQKVSANIFTTFNCPYHKTVRL